MTFFVLCLFGCFLKSLASISIPPITELKHGGRGARGEKEEMLHKAGGSSKAGRVVRQCGRSSGCVQIS